MKFDSGYEKRIWENNKVTLLEYHPLRLKYSVEYEGIPDFVIKRSDKIILIEAKGNPRHFNSDKRKRLLSLKNQLPEQYELRMLIEKRSIRLPDRKLMTIDRWATLNDIPFAIGDKIPDNWFLFKDGE